MGGIHLEGVGGFGKGHRRKMHAVKNDKGNVIKYTPRSELYTFIRTISYAIGDLFFFRQDN